MTKSSILSVIAAVTMLPVAVAQEPAPTPAVPEGVMMTTRAFVNGKEVTPAEAEEVMKSMRAQIRSRLLGEIPADAAAPEPERPQADTAPELTPLPPALGAPQPAPEPAPEPAVTPAPAPAVAPPPAEPTAVPAARIEPAEGGVRLIVNGREVKPHTVKVLRVPAPGPRPAGQARPACQARSAAAAKTTCPQCGKVRPVVRPAVGAVPPCGKARLDDNPAYGTTPPCVRRHGQTMNPVVHMREARPAVDLRKGPQPVSSPQAVRVIINGVETVMPVLPEGVNITIKSL